MTGNWAADPTGDSEQALKELCETVAAAVREPVPTPPGGNRPFGGPTLDATTRPNQAVLEDLNVLLTAVAGAADIATSRVRDLEASLALDDSTSRARGDSLVSVLIRFGRDALAPFIDGDRR